MPLTHEKRLTLNEMNDLLKQFDEELSEMGYDGVVPIRALGGYAMLSHGMRQDNPTTPDIDTATPSFDRIANKARLAVAKRNNLTDHWLNNDTVLSFGDDADWNDVSVSDAMIDAKYETVPLGLTHVNVSVATIDTLMRAKAIAACDTYSERGDKDLDDCLSILDNENAHSYVAATKRFPFLKDPDFAYFRDLYNIATKTSGEMRAVRLQAHRDMLKSSGLDAPDFGSEIDDFAYGYEDDNPFKSYDYEDDDLFGSYGYENDYLDDFAY